MFYRLTGSRKKSDLKQSMVAEHTVHPGPKPCLVAVMMVWVGPDAVEPMEPTEPTEPMELTEPHAAEPMEEVEQEEEMEPRRKEIKIHRVGMGKGYGSSATS